MSSLIDILYLVGESPIEIILGSDGLEQYEKVKALLQQKAEPVLMNYLDNLHIRETLQKVTTPEDLENVEIEFISVSFKQLLANLIDAEPFTIPQKVWLFSVFLNSFYQGAAAHIRPYFNGRYEELNGEGKIVKSSYLNTLKPEDFSNNAINHQLNEHDELELI